MVRLFERLDPLKVIELVNLKGTDFGSIWSLRPQWTQMAPAAVLGHCQGTSLVEQGVVRGSSVPLSTTVTPTGLMDVPESDFSSHNSYILLLVLSIKAKQKKI